MLSSDKIFALATVIMLTIAAARYEITAAQEHQRAPSCPASLGPSASVINVPATRADDTLSPSLDQGADYSLLVTGTFVYNSLGSRSDGIDLLLDGNRIAQQRLPEHRYCIELRGSGKPLRFKVNDVNAADNSGVLTVSIAKKGEARR